jgi:hypothetical protein
MSSVLSHSTAIIRLRGSPRSSGAVTDLRRLVGCSKLAAFNDEIHSDDASGSGSIILDVSLDALTLRALFSFNLVY